MKILFGLILTFVASTALQAAEEFDPTYLIGKHFQSDEVISFIQKHWLIDDIADIEKEWRTPSYLETAKYIGGFDPRKKKITHPIEIQAFDGIVSTINIHANKKMDKKVTKRLVANGFFTQTFYGGFRFDMPEAESKEKYVYFEANNSYRKFFTETMMLSFSYSKKKGNIRRITYGKRYND